ncbi:MAG: type IV secretion system DNA-binding domain-containing protein [Chloroflexi bacterium]|nr:type IV secretion system DNA-binding domain-containing protein [Chloroflexota bacterium]
MAIAKDGEFFLGKVFDLEKSTLTDSPLSYDPGDLTTHAIVTGMTGSGKTGMCVGLLEEAAVEGIPAIIIDPKGDLTNLLLHFPDLAPEAFEPWIDPDLARREGKDLATKAVETAEGWRKGLEGWGLGTEDIQTLKDSVRFGLFTPGSSAGTPVNILSSFVAPEVPWNDHREMLREKIATIVTALLGLIGITDLDPLRSREHILLSNVLEDAWSKGESLSLVDLILRTQNPPFESLGAFPVDNFFPAKDRSALAMRLNSFLASPSFEVWREGQPLDIGAMLYGPSGKPRHNIFYLAHLNDSERMFFVTLLFASIESWMRTQRGTSSLRALVYFDEIVGYLPPVANPPSRPIMLRMLKQARAFGVGLLLATQNPIDVDYRGLSNAGTWVIGRLQTDQDKQRLLDGLDSAGGGLDRREVDRIISALPKRTFFIHNIHARGPQIFQTRWVLNYLAGPLMRSQIPELLKLDGVEALPSAAPASVEATTPAAPSALTPAAGPTPAPAVVASAVAAQPPEAPTPVAELTGAGEVLSTTRPAPPARTEEYLLPADLTAGAALAKAGLAGRGTVEGPLLYKPALYGQASITYNVPKYDIRYERRVSVLPLEARGNSVTWDDFGWKHYQAAQLQYAEPEARFTQLPAWLSDARQLTAWRRDLEEWLYRTATIEVRTLPSLGVSAGPDVSQEEFEARARRAAEQAAQTQVDKLTEAHKKKLDDQQAKIRRQEDKILREETQHNQRRLEEAGSAVETVLGFLGIGRKRSISTNLTKRRMTAQDRMDVRREKAVMEDLVKELEDLEARHADQVRETREQIERSVQDVQITSVTPYKKDIFIDLFGIAWCPYYTVIVNGVSREVPAFSAD